MSLLAQMRASWRNASDSVDVSADTMAQTLAEFALKSGMKISQSARCKKVTQYEAASESRRRVLCTELLGISLCTVYFGIEDALYFMPAKQKDYWYAVQQAVVPSLTTLFKPITHNNEVITLLQEMVAIQQDGIHVTAERVRLLAGDRFKVLTRRDRETHMRILAIAQMCDIHVQRLGTNPLSGSFDFFHDWIADLDRHCQLRMRGM